MNCTLIFAGGTGQRMNSRTRPKQFLELHGKPIIVYTLEQFQDHPEVDAIVVVCLESWISHLKRLVDQYGLSKVVQVVPGGQTGQESIYLGLSALRESFSDEDVVLIHDGVRPLIDEDTISACIRCATENGSAVTVVPAIETVVKQEGGKIVEVIARQDCCSAKAPQCFRLGDICEAHAKSQQDGRDDFIDSASLMHHYGFDIYTVEGKPENIKITTPSDFYMFRAMLDERENSQIFGIG